MSAYAFPRDPDDVSEIRFEERHGDVVMWVALILNPWCIQFSEENLLRWWAAHPKSLQILEPHSN